jgi:hypothetical protein
MVLALVAGGWAIATSPFRALAGVLAAYAVLAALATPRGPFAVAPARDRARSVLVVDAATGPIDWTTDIRTGTAHERDVFSTFLAWLSRVGVEPEVLTQGVYSDATHPVLVLDPSRSVSPAQQAQVDTYVREGGRLLVLDDPVQRPASTAPALLATFGIRYQFEVAESTLHEAAGPQLPRVVWALPLTLLQETRREPGRALADRTRLDVSLTGVEPLWVDEHGLVVYGRKTVGKGRVHVFARSSMFSQLVLGDVWGGVEPGSEKEQLYQLEYTVLRDLFAHESVNAVKDDMPWEP